MPMDKEKRMQKREHTQKRQHSAGGLRRRAIFCLLLLALAAAGGTAWYVSRSPLDDTTRYWFDQDARRGSLSGAEPRDVQGMLNDIVEEGMFNVSVNARVVFADGTSQGSLGLENIKANRYVCRAVLVRDADGAVLYESGGLEPGQYIDKITLTEDLDAGIYPCTVQVTAADPESQEEIGRVDVAVEVEVLN